MDMIITLRNSHGPNKTPSLSRYSVAMTNIWDIAISAISRFQFWIIALLFASCLFTDKTVAQEDIPKNEDIVSYPASFFERYQPNNAYDMVRQIPGFQINDGDNLRGFGGVGGNILINGKRPSAKDDALSAILSRIPVRHIDRIDLLRGQIPGIDLRGQSVVANIILYSEMPLAVRWYVQMRKNSLVSTVSPEVNISLSSRWNSIDYNLGFLGYRPGFGNKGTTDVMDGSDNLLEKRFDSSRGTNLTGNVFLNASTWIGETLLQMNTKARYANRKELITSQRVSQPPNSSHRDVLFDSANPTKSFELGIDAERSLNENLVGKAIILANFSRQDGFNDQRVIESSGIQSLYRISDSERKTDEIIARLEFDLRAWSNHVVQFNIDGAYNVLDNSLVQTRDTGAGPVFVDVPTSNTKVEETRANIHLKDNWSIGRNWTLDYGIGAEISEISQSGSDTGQKRNFFFLKPESLMNYTFNQNRQLRFRLAREVGQLSFGNFVSATVFLDDDLSLGNPDLSPEKTWLAEFEHELRFGGLGALTVKLFHHWISDVQDLLPITDDLEVPGNIGDGKRWGIQIESTIPLQGLGLEGARLDIRARWQVSNVTDPVTGNDRKLTAGGGFTGVPSATFTGPPTGLSLSGENEYAVRVAYRQDFRVAQTAWGWAVSERGQRPRFKVDELDVYDEGTVIDAFIETTRWWGIKIRLDGNNLLDLNTNRERTIFTGRRGLSSVNTRELGTERVGRRFTISLSGSF